ncbi:unnamed protein product [Owenia fusiformis]|uniref:Uncharacterized protein n=1 Tax=Owenia fusiformis TaxID=6347 RepID=A0A8S4Q1E6_OWEFU|nr:unnamed protein product [Owenia fusiformis]
MVISYGICQEPLRHPTGKHKNGSLKKQNGSKRRHKYAIGKQRADKHPTGSKPYKHLKQIDKHLSCHSIHREHSFMSLSPQGQHHLDAESFPDPFFRDFEDSHLRNCNLNEYLSRDPDSGNPLVRHSTFNASQLKDSKMRLQSQYRDSQFRDSQFRDAQIRDTQFRDARLRDTQFRDAQIRYTQFRDARLRDTQLRDAQLRDTQLRKTQLRDTHLRDTEFRDAKLRDTQSRDNQFRDTHLRDTQSKGLQLTKTNHKDIQYREPEFRNLKNFRYSHSLERHGNITYHPDLRMTVSNSGQHVQICPSEQCWAYPPNVYNENGIQLEDILDHWDPETSRISGAFSKQFWLQYEEYCFSYRTIKQLLRCKRENDDEFAQFCRLRRGVTKHSLNSLLLQPVQRIPEYDHYLSDLLDETDHNHPDYEELSRAATKVQNMVKERGDEVNFAENEFKVENVQDRFPNDNLGLQSAREAIASHAPPSKSRSMSRRKSAPSAVLLKTLSGKKHSSANFASSLNSSNTSLPETVSPRGFGGHALDINRTYVTEGPVQFTTGLQTQERYLFLFNDLLLIAKQKSSTAFKLKHRIRVREMWTASCLDEVCESHKTHDKSFVIGWPTTNVVATFSTPELKETWENKLKQQIADEKAKEEPKTITLKVLNKDMDTFPSQRSFIVSNTDESRECVKLCMQHFEIQEGSEDYQLWVVSGKEDSPYPLIGHEHPYSIKMSHVRDGNKNEEVTSSTDLDSSDKMAPQCQFILRKAKKAPMKLSLEDSGSGGKRGTKKKGKSPNFLRLFKSKKDESEPTSPGPAGKLFEHKLTDVCIEECLPKPIIDMLFQLYHVGPTTDGIFRKGANQRKVRELREKLDVQEEVSLDDIPTLVIGACFKEFLRTMPDCIMQSDLYSKWVDTVNIKDNKTRVTAVKSMLELLPRCNQKLLKYFTSVLYNIHEHSSENQMTAHNLAICIGPSMLYAPMTESPAVQTEALGKVPICIQFMIENCEDVFGKDVLTIFGEPLLPLQKTQPDSSTDSDSIHSVLSMQETQGFGRDTTSSIDSFLERDICYSEQEGSPRMTKNHLSPSNLSRDSGLTLSDNQLYSEDGDDVIDSMHRMPKLTRSTTNLEFTKSLNNMERPTPPVPPPRRHKRRVSEPPAPVEHKHYLSTGAAGTTLNTTMSASQLPSMTSSLNDSPRAKSMHAEMMPHMRLKYPQTMASLQVTEDTESPQYRFTDLRNRNMDMGTVRKSASGARLYLDETLLHDSDITQFTKSRSLDRDSGVGSTPSADEVEMPTFSPQSRTSQFSSQSSLQSDNSFDSTGTGNDLERRMSEPPTPSSGENPWEKLQQQELAGRLMGSTNVKLPKQRAPLPPTKKEEDTNHRSSLTMQIEASPELVKMHQQHMFSPIREDSVECDDLPQKPLAPQTPKAKIQTPQVKIQKVQIQQVPSMTIPEPTASHDVTPVKVTLREVTPVKASPPESSSPHTTAPVPMDTESHDAPPRPPKPNPSPVSVPVPTRVVMRRNDGSYRRRPSSPPPSVLLRNRISDTQAGLQSRGAMFFQGQHPQFQKPQSAQNPNVKAMPHHLNSDQYSLERSASDTTVREQFEQTPTRPVQRHRSSVTPQDYARPAKPPTYQEALQRKQMLSEIPVFRISEEDKIRQKMNSARASQLYEQSMRQMQQMQQQQQENTMRHVEPTHKQSVQNSQITKNRTPESNHGNTQAGNSNNQINNIRCRSSPEKDNNNTLEKDNVHHKNTSINEAIDIWVPRNRHKAKRTPSIEERPQRKLSTNLKRSKSDSQEHLHKVGKVNLKKLALFSVKNKENHQKESPRSATPKDASKSRATVLKVSRNSPPHSNLNVPHSVSVQRSNSDSSSRQQDLNDKYKRQNDSKMFYLPEADKTGNDSRTMPRKSLLKQSPSRGSSDNLAMTKKAQLSWSVAKLRQTYDTDSDSDSKVSSHFFNPDRDMSKAYRTSRDNRQSGPPSFIQAPHLFQGLRKSPSTSDLPTKKSFIEADNGPESYV